MSGRLRLKVLLRPGSAGDADGATAGLRTGGRLNQPCRHVRARDPIRQAPSASLGELDHRSAARSVGEPARVDDGPIQVAVAQRLLSGALVFDHRAHGETCEKPRDWIEATTFDKKRGENDDAAEP